jgi:hypothetical protein
MRRRINNEVELDTSVQRLMEQYGEEQVARAVARARRKKPGRKPANLPETFDALLYLTIQSRLQHRGNVSAACRSLVREYKSLQQQVHRDYLEAVRSGRMAPLKEESGPEPTMGMTVGNLRRRYSEAAKKVRNGTLIVTLKPEAFGNVRDPRRGLASLLDMAVITAHLTWLLPEDQIRAIQTGLDDAVLGFAVVRRKRS